MFRQPHIHWKEGEDGVFPCMGPRLLGTQVNANVFTIIPVYDIVFLYWSYYNPFCAPMLYKITPFNWGEPPDSSSICFVMKLIFMYMYMYSGKYARGPKINFSRAQALIFCAAYFKYISPVAWFEFNFILQPVVGEACSYHAKLVILERK